MHRGDVDGNVNSVVQKLELLGCAVDEICILTRMNVQMSGRGVDSLAGVRLEQQCLAYVDEQDPGARAYAL